MTRGSSQVDLGPLYMPVGDTAGSDTRRAPLPRDAERFQQLVTPIQSAHTALPFLSPFQAENEGGVSAGAAQSSLAADLERLWLERGADFRREIRAGDTNAILPGMALLMYEHAGPSGLEFGLEVRCGANASTGWLVPRVPSLARDLAQRLGKPVGVRVYEADGTIAASTRSEASA